MLSLKPFFISIYMTCNKTRFEQNKIQFELIDFEIRTMSPANLTVFKNVYHYYFLFYDMKRHADLSDQSNQFVILVDKGVASPCHTRPRKVNQLFHRQQAECKKNMSFNDPDLILRQPWDDQRRVLFLKVFMNYLIFSLSLYQLRYRNFLRLYRKKKQRFDLFIIIVS